MPTKNVKSPFGYSLGVLTTPVATHILTHRCFFLVKVIIIFFLNYKFNYLKETSLNKQTMQYNFYCNSEGLKGGIQEQPHFYVFLGNTIRSRFDEIIICFRSSTVLMLNALFSFKTNPFYLLISIAPAKHQAIPGNVCVKLKLYIFFGHFFNLFFLYKS